MTNLIEVRDQLGADLVVAWQPSGPSGRVLVAYGADLPPGADWPLPRPGLAGGTAPQIVTDPDAIAALLANQARLQLARPVCACAVVPAESGGIALAWCTAPGPDLDGRLDALAPTLRALHAAAASASLTQRPGAQHRHAERAPVLGASDSETLLRAVLDSLPDVFGLLDPVRDARGEIVDFRYADANRACLDRNGHSREQHLGLLVSQVWPNFRGSELFRFARTVLETGESPALGAFYQENVSSPAQDGYRRAWAMPVGGVSPFVCPRRRDCGYFRCRRTVLPTLGRPPRPIGEPSCSHPHARPARSERSSVTPLRTRSRRPPAGRARGARAGWSGCRTWCSPGAVRRG